MPADAAAVAAFRALQAKARAEHGGNTQPLLVVYAVESFLRRLAISDYADRMVLKGGMLMAASNIRRMTRDADLSTHGLANGEQHVRDAVTRVCALEPDPHDGVVFDPTSIRTEVMREGDEYQGVRCKLIGALGRARSPFALDFSFGDPGQSTVIDLESVIDRPAIRLAAYPLALNLAEKIVTAMQRRETSTRDRDFADLWVTSRRHRLDAAELHRHITAVAAHRGQPVIPMAQALAHMPVRQGPYAAMVDRMSYLSPPPQRWSDLIDGVIAFVDPLLADASGRLSHWHPQQLAWKPKAAGAVPEDPSRAVPSERARNISVSRYPYQGASTMQFDVYADTSGNYRWRLKAANGQKVATSGESFASQSNATRAAEGFKAGAKTYTYETYEDSGGYYRWRAKASNGQKVASSGESFASSSNATRAAENVRDNAGNATGP